MVVPAMNYYYTISGVQKDPVSESTLRDLIVAGSVGSGELCWTDSWTDWRPVTTAFPELFSGVRTPPSLAANASMGQAPAEQEETRRTFLKHEASVQSIGILYLIGAVALIAAGIGGFVVGGKTPEESPAITMAVAALLITLGLVQGQVGLWLRKLNPKSRIPATIFSGLGLLAFPIGTVINGYILYLIHSKKGAVVFSPAYRDVIAATPHIKYKTSVITWMFLGLIIVLLVLGLFATTTARR